MARPLRAARRILPWPGPISANARRLLLANLFSSTAVGAIAVVYNLYLVDLHYGLGVVGLLSAVSTVAVAGASLSVSVLAQRFSARRIMLAGTALLLLASLAVTVLTSVPALFALSVLSGAGAALAGNLVGPTLMEECPPAQQAHLFSAYFAVANGGAMLGSLLSSLVALLAGLLALSGGGDGILAHRLVLAGGALVGLAALPLLARLTPPAPIDHGEGASQIKRLIAPARAHPGRDLAAILVAVAILAASLGLGMPFINVYFEQVAHATTSQIGLIFSVTSALTTVTTFAAPALAERFGKLQAFTATRVLSAPCLMLLAWHVPLAAAAGAFLWRNILGNISGALDNNFMFEVLPPWSRARAAGWRAAVFNASTALTSYGAGLLITAIGYSPLFVASGVLTILAMAIYFGYFRFTSA
jgi:MFS family permease